MSASGGRQMTNRDGSEPNDDWATPSWLYDKLDIKREGR